ncbi:MAG: ABC transporter substrate-binding protein [Proteobacteria bacterium]|nr:ABC transporter substrate-binding protein [Pseudomonadota bacterium]
MRPPFRRLLVLTMLGLLPALAVAAPPSVAPTPAPSAPPASAPAPSAPGASAPVPATPAPKAPAAGTKAAAPMALAHPLKPLSVITFAGGFDLPLWVAERQGYFTAHGLDVRITYTPGSIYEMSNLIAGTYDIGMAAFDNVVAYDEGQGAWPVPANPDVVAVLGEDDGFLSLVSQKPYTTIASLRGKTLSVDAMTTGFAFVLEALLAKNGIQPNEVHFVEKGGSAQRFHDMLKDKAIAATIQITPFDLLSAAHGMHVLARVGEVLGPYQGQVAAVRRAWAMQHRQEVIDFIRAYRQAVDWLYQPANREVAAAILVAHLPAMTFPLANKTLAVLLAPKGGLARDAMPDMAGVRLVLALRTKYGVPPKVLNNPMQYLDLSYLNAAAH